MDDKFNDKNKIISLEDRIKEDELLDAQDLIEQIQSVGGIVDLNGYVTVYHATNKENAEMIRKSGKMSSKEDGIFFSTKSNGEISGYGDSTIAFKFPVEKLELNDIFEGEIHLRIPLRNRNQVLDVSKHIEINSFQDKAKALQAEELIHHFKDSKVRDSDGNLQVVYHGTGTLISEFDDSFTGQGNDQFGSGFYFTTDKLQAEAYQTASLPGKEKLGGSDNPNLIAAYLNITNPIVAIGESLKESNVKLTASKVAKIIKQAPNINNIDESPLGDTYDIWEEGIQEWMIKDAAKNCKSLIHLENTFFKDYPTEFRKAVNRVLGCDGVVHEFKSGIKHYVAWFPEQIKIISRYKTKDLIDEKTVSGKKSLKDIQNKIDEHKKMKKKCKDR